MRFHVSAIIRIFMIQSSYRCTSNVKLPLRVIPTVHEIGTSQVSYSIVVKANFNNKLNATNVVLRIPTPLNTTTVDCKVVTGKAKYVPEENVVIWKCISFSKCAAVWLTTVQDTPYPRRTRAHIQRCSGSNKHNTPPSMGKTAHRR